MKPVILLSVLFALLLPALTGCHGAGHVEFTGGHCVVNGHPAQLAEVEALQAQISERILARQPLFVVITLLVVVLAGASHLEKVVLLFSTRKAHTHGLGERIRLALDRYRDRPLRYFSIVVGTLLLLGIAGGFYVYLDADKRASERALGQLQFCHLALRNGEAESILDEQKHNLEAIQSTAGNIRTLVDKLPPAEQAQAKQMVDRIGQVLARQGKLVGDYMQQTTESSKEAQQHDQLLERGLSSLETNVGALKGLPQSLRELSDQVGKVDGKVTARHDDLDAKLAALKASLDALAARPAPKCACESAPAKQAERPIEKLDKPTAKPSPERSAERPIPKASEKPPEKTPEPGAE